MEKRLSALLRLAIKSNASDIHLSLRYGEVTIQMRVDGDLKKVKPKIGDDRLIRYLQYLSNLDIGTSIDPQTGKFEYYIDDVLLSLRFAVITMPDRIDGVLRIMNSSLKIDEEHLSCRKWQNELFHSLVRRENGQREAARPLLSIICLNRFPTRRFIPLRIPLRSMMKILYSCRLIELPV